MRQLVARTHGPFRYKKNLHFHERTVEDAGPYNVCGGRCAAILFVLAVYFMRATNGRPYKSNKTLSMPVGEDSISSRNVVRIYQKPSPVGEGGSRRLTDEVSASLFAPSFGGAQTNENHLTPCRDRASGQQVASLSVSLFAPSFGFAQTNENHLNLCRDRRPRLSVVGKIYFRI